MIIQGLQEECDPVRCQFFSGGTRDSAGDKMRGKWRRAEAKEGVIENFSLRYIIIRHVAAGHVQRDMSTSESRGLIRSWSSGDQKKRLWGDGGAIRRSETIFPARLLIN